MLREFLPTDTINLAAEITGGDLPYTYEWSYDGASLGSGQNLQVSTGLLPLGPSTITVLA